MECRTTQRCQHCSENHKTSALSCFQTELENLSKSRRRTTSWCGFCSPEGPRLTHLDDGGRWLTKATRELQHVEKLTEKVVSVVFVRLFTIFTYSPVERWKLFLRCSSVCRFACVFHFPILTCQMPLPRHRRSSLRCRKHNKSPRLEGCSVLTVDV